ncbi:MAG: ribonuclease III [Brevinematia bacterium]
MFFFRKLPFDLPKDRINQLLKLEKELGVRFKDIYLLHQSLVHLSYLRYSSNGALYSNERLEFVGDAVISMVIATYIYNNYPSFDEGILSSIKSDVVSRKVMYKIGESLNLGNYILTFPPLEKFDLRGRRTIISNAVESLVGGYYISNGFKDAEKFILKLFSKIISARIKEGSNDYKSLLQIFTLTNFDEYPSYRLVEEKGPNHRKEFVVKVFVNGVVGEGKGFSKKEAEQSAAKDALEKLKNNYKST